jgi:hypothetical protein
MNRPLPRNPRRRTLDCLCLPVAVAATLLFPCGCGPRPSTARARPMNDYLTQKARESGGDFNKLSPEDQKRVQSMTQGHGPQAIRSRAGK